MTGFWLSYNSPWLRSANSGNTINSWALTNNTTNSLNNINTNNTNGLLPALRSDLADYGLIDYR